ncbi:MAG TPA: hypothetical protein PL009_03055 [Flavipsychrobacter sp.]|nr:hypothetical protein [Flavipsychrobacter sp.]
MTEVENKSLFTYHLIKVSFLSALKCVLFPIKSSKINGLIHAETMSAMMLGSSIFAPTRLFSRTIVVFAQWNNEDALNKFLRTDSFGNQLSKSWYLKLRFIRQWGSISHYDIPKSEIVIQNEFQPIVAVTLARMKYTEIPRFLRWGKPVEKLVRDHSGTAMSLASIRYPNLISTFSVWKSQKEMSDMVYGHSKMPQAKRHFDAMKERNRKDFHFEFTTLRFLPVSEHGTWNGKSNYLPNVKTDL